ncbi:hypothetical protein RvY_04414 [Ramazzottius varieornatus]|uniref:Uncharacterized protein n=1 Tax=Ramazzottius varieornatus TaxID=947166 RepID=A0A1D1V1I8_RAMVA|nr:hypothetical protein RvY_04414 [Ramazzottius varieornatus]
MISIKSWTFVTLVLCAFLSGCSAAKNPGRRNRSTTPSSVSSTVAAPPPSVTASLPVLSTTIKAGSPGQRNRSSSKNGGRRSQSKSPERIKRQIGSPYGMVGAGLGGFGGGYGLPINSAATGSAIGTANALMGQATSNGQTFTNPMGYSSSNANGFASGYSPSSTSIANSNSQGGFLGRRKRYAESALPFLTV